VALGFAHNKLRTIRIRLDRRYGFWPNQLAVFTPDFVSPTSSVGMRSFIIHMSTGKARRPNAEQLYRNLPNAKLL